MINFGLYLEMQDNNVAIQSPVFSLFEFFFLNSGLVQS